MTTLGVNGMGMTMLVTKHNFTRTTCYNVHMGAYDWYATVFIGLLLDTIITIWQFPQESHLMTSCLD